MNSFEAFGQAKLLQAQAERDLSATLARSVAAAFGRLRTRVSRFISHGQTLRFPRR